MHSSCLIDLWNDCTLRKGEGEEEEGGEEGREGGRRGSGKEKGEGARQEGSGECLVLVI